VKDADATQAARITQRMILRVGEFELVRFPVRMRQVKSSPVRAPRHCGWIVARDREGSRWELP
jgi:hypothetical protein